MEKGHSSLGSAGELTDVLCEFLEVAVHLVLRISNIYPSEIFERRRHLNVPVQWIRHPELRDYIHSAIFSLHSWIQQGQVEKVVVMFMDSKQAPLENFVFKLNLNRSFAGTVPLNDIEYTLRAFFIKLSLSESLLQPLPEDCTFEIVAYSKQLPGDASGKGQFWISTDAQSWQQPITVTPIKSMRSEPLNLQLYVEQPAEILLRPK